MTRNSKKYQFCSYYKNNNHNIKINGLWSHYKPKDCTENPRNEKQDQNTGTTSPGREGIKINFAECDHKNIDNDGTNTVGSG